jgi:uncharacterized membrane protein
MENAILLLGYLGSFTLACWIGWVMRGKTEKQNILAIIASFFAFVILCIVWIVIALNSGWVGLMH